METITPTIIIVESVLFFTLTYKENMNAIKVTKEPNNITKLINIFIFHF